MTNEFITPEELSDERLLYWATHHAKKYLQAQKALTTLQARHEAFLAECMDRDLAGELLERLSNG